MRQLAAWANLQDLRINIITYVVKNSKARKTNYEWALKVWPESTGFDFKLPLWMHFHLNFQSLQVLKTDEMRNRRKLRKVWKRIIYQDHFSPKPQHTCISYWLEKNVVPSKRFNCGVHHDLETRGKIVMKYLVSLWESSIFDYWDDVIVVFQVPSFHISNCGFTPMFYNS